MAHTKFAVNLSKLCRDTASDAVWHHANKFIDALFENGLVYQKAFDNFLSGWSEDDLSQIW